MTTLAAAIRFVHLAALSLLIGSFAFDYFVERPALTKTGGEQPAKVEALERFRRGLVRWSLLAAFLVGLAGFFIQTASVTGSLTPAAIWGVLIGTQSGMVWVFRAGLMLLLAALLYFPREKNNSKYLNNSVLVIAMVIVMAQAFSGHAAAGEGGKLAVQLVADSLHALAASVWLGGLVSFAFFLVWLRRADEQWSKDVGKEATRRFSVLGLASVGILVVTGLFNAWNLVGAVPPLVGTTYGKLLLAKLGLLLPLIVIAAINLLELKPAILSMTTRRGLEQSKNLFRRLKRNVVAEASLGACILLIVGAMSVTPPARHIQPSWPFSSRWNWSAVEKNPKIRSEVALGNWLAATGFIGVCFALVRRRKRYWLAGAGLAASAYGGIVVSSALSIDAYPTTYGRPSVPYQAISVANGLRLYQESCATCHGISGYGDGPSGKELKPKPAADLTAKHTADHTVGDLFWWLNHGIKETAMPGFHQSLSEEEIWDLINFLRTLSAAEQARSMAPLAERPWLVAPDFVYGTAQVEGEALKDRRGRNIVLLVLFAERSKTRLEELAQAYEKLRSLGVEVLAIPREQEQRTHPSVGFLPVVTDGGQEIFATYALFRRSFSADGTLPDPPIPGHVEFLIDRQGYVRARWIQGEDIGWSKMENLLREIDGLNKEKPSAPAPDDHVH